MDKRDDDDKEFEEKPSHNFDINKKSDPRDENIMMDDAMDLIKDIIRNGPPSRRDGVDIIAGSGVDSLKRVLEDIMSGKMKASVHVLGDPSDRDGSIKKITECLPCMEELFANLYYDKKEDKIAYAGYMCLKVLIECMRIDLENDNSETCNMLGITLNKFCEITGLDKTKHFKGGYHTSKKFK